MKSRNRLKYGNENGPIAEYLLKKYGSWDKVIEKINVERFIIHNDIWFGHKLREYSNGTKIKYKITDD